MLFRSIEFGLFLFGEDGDFFEETLTLTSGLCYQWLHVILLAFVAGEQENGLVLSFRSVKQTCQLTKTDPI